MFYKHKIQQICLGDEDKKEGEKKSPKKSLKRDEKETFNPKNAVELMIVRYIGP